MHFHHYIRIAIIMVLPPPQACMQHADYSLHHDVTHQGLGSHSTDSMQQLYYNYTVLQL